MGLVFDGKPKRRVFLRDIIGGYSCPNMLFVVPMRMTSKVKTGEPTLNLLFVDQDDVPGVHPL